MEKDWQNQLAFDLNACFKAEFVANCLSVISEYELNISTLKTIWCSQQAVKYVH